MVSPSVRSQSEATWSSRVNTTFTPPTGLADDDILLAFIYVSNTSEGGTSISPPAGFAQIGTDLYVEDAAFSYGHIGNYWKRAASESGNYTFTVNSGNTTGQVGLLLAIQNAKTSGSPVDAASQNAGSKLATSTTSSGTSGFDATFLSVTTTAADDLLLLVSGQWGNLDNGINTPPTGYTSLFGTEQGAALYAASKDVSPGIGATGDVVLTVNKWVDDPWLAYQIAISAVSGVVTVSPSVFMRDESAQIIRGTCFRVVMIES